METARKITVAVPPELLERAQRASGSDITQTGSSKGVRQNATILGTSHGPRPRRPPAVQSQ
jgi:hypothetical protein